jgi:DNA polymerase, archaea type
MALSKHNKSEVLDAMQAVSELTGLSFEPVCQTRISTWWAAIFDNMISNGECEQPSKVYSVDKIENGDHRQQRDYTDGIVLEPKKGLHHNLAVVDVSSLYPTMAILYNISFDTVNCKCCKNNPDAIVDKDIIKDCLIEKEYWIYQLNKEGAFPKKLRIFKEERFSQKRTGNEVKHKKRLYTNITEPFYMRGQNPTGFGPTVT